MNWYSTLSIAFCLAGACLVYSDSMDLFIAWYSGADPPLTTKAKALVVGRCVLVLLAILAVGVGTFVKRQ